jgi:5-enolpyruvylshikimate-3-phosphate synthase
MHQRPIGDLVEALVAMGASIDYLGAKVSAVIHAGALGPGGTVEVR